MSTGFTTLATGTISDLVTQGLIVLAAIMGLAAGFFLVRWAWRKIRGHMH